MLGGLARARPDDRHPGVVDLIRKAVALIETDSRDHAGQRAGDVVEGVVVVVADDHAPVPAQPRSRTRAARLLDRRRHRRRRCYEGLGTLTTTSSKLAVAPLAFLVAPTAKPEARPCRSPAARSVKSATSTLPT